jgi:hypothetical protein
MAFAAHATATCRMRESSEFFIFFAGQPSRAQKNRNPLIPKRLFYVSSESSAVANLVNRFLLRMRKKGH